MEKSNLKRTPKRTSGLFVSDITYGLHEGDIDVGLPTIIIRLAGCNLAEEGHPCHWCNTQYAQFTERGEELSVEDIMIRVKEYPTSDCLITGGEPFYQNSFSLIRELKNDGYKTTIDTNGTISLHGYLGVCLVMDIKCPSSGNDKYNLYFNIPTLNYADQLKFVIKDREDFEFALGILNGYIIRARILFSPVWEIMDSEELGEWIKGEWPRGRLSPRLYGAM